MEVDEELGEDADEGAGDAHEGAVAVGAHAGGGVVLRREGGDSADLLLVRAWRSFIPRVWTPSQSFLSADRLCLECKLAVFPAEHTGSVKN